MKVEKIVIDDVKRCYSVQEINLEGENYFFFASEDPFVGASLYKEKDLKQKIELWNEAGGCMSLIPHREHQFLAIQDFYLKVSPSMSKLVLGTVNEQGVVIQDLLHLPYLHRFDIFHQGDVDYLLLATVADDKENKDDWSKAGKIYGAVLPKDVSQGIKLEVLQDGLFRNHGYSRSEENGQPCGLIASDQGVLQVFPPKSLGDVWQIKSILEQTQVSEAVLLDIDGDGLKEMMTIEPFHGNQIKIYKQKNGKFVCDYIYPNKIDFAHALVADTVLNQPTFIAGIRREDAELVLIQVKDNHYCEIMVDKQGGPANLKLVHRENEDYILAANHTQNEAVLYKLSKEE